MSCSVAQCLEVVGEWWSLLIVRDALLGVTRFDDFQRRLGISRNVLRDRLSRLVAEGVFDKVHYQEHPVRYDYRLTDKGRDLSPVVTALREWGDRHTSPGGPPVRLVHTACGSDVHLVHRCERCAQTVERTDVRVVPGPAYANGLIPRAEPRAEEAAAWR